MFSRKISFYRAVKQTQMTKRGETERKENGTLRKKLFFRRKTQKDLSGIFVGGVDWGFSSEAQPHLGVQNLGAEEEEPVHRLALLPRA